MPINFCAVTTISPLPPEKFCGWAYHSTILNINYGRWPTDCSACHFLHLRPRFLRALKRHKIDLTGYGCTTVHPYFYSYLIVIYFFKNVLRHHPQSMPITHCPRLLGMLAYSPSLPAHRMIMNNILY